MKQPPAATPNAELRTAGQEGYSRGQLREAIATSSPATEARHQETPTPGRTDSPRAATPLVPIWGRATFKTSFPSTECSAGPALLGPRGGWRTPDAPGWRSACSLLSLPPLPPLPPGPRAPHTPQYLFKVSRHPGNSRAKPARGVWPKRGGGKARGRP